MCPNLCSTRHDCRIHTLLLTTSITTRENQKAMSTETVKDDIAQNPAYQTGVQLENVVKQIAQRETELRELEGKRTNVKAASRAAIADNPESVSKEAAKLSKLDQQIIPLNAEVELLIEEKTRLLDLFPELLVGVDREQRAAECAIDAENELIRRQFFTSDTFIQALAVMRAAYLFDDKPADIKHWLNMAGFHADDLDTSGILPELKQYPENKLRDFLKYFVRQNEKALKERGHSIPQTDMPRLKNVA